jgi:hypothetical protein
MHWSDSIKHGYTVNGLFYIEGEALNLLQIIATMMHDNITMLQSFLS